MSRLISPFLALFILTSCASIEPYIQDFNIVSVPQERALSAQLQTEVAKQMKLVESNEWNQLVRSTGATLVARLPRRDFDYQFYVVEDSTPNAFTIPGGTIYVHTGLLKMTDRNELAGVLAHEIGHGYERHPTKLISREYGAQYISELIFGKQSGKSRTIMLNIAAGSLLSRYSQQEEYRADEIGFSLLRRSGFPTYGLLSFLSKIQQLGGSSPLPFLSSHPPTPNRIARLQAFERNQIAPVI